ncbi:MAG: enoyl-CoA hydratase/isomerase family protein [Gaiellales bacterium]
MPGLRITSEARVSVVTVNRPEVLNALNTALLEELLATLTDLGADETCGVIVVTGAGDRSFIAGADIKEMDGKTPLEARAYSELGQEIAHMLEVMRKPTIAAVNGYALGGGLEIALACDIRLASPGGYKLGTPEVTLGLLPGNGGTQRLTRLLGPSRALDLLLTGRTFSPDEALAWGLVAALVDEDGARAYAERLAAGPRLALAAIKRCVHEGGERSLADGLALEAELVEQLFRSKDAGEGLTAFVEKRAPEFVGA